MIVVVHSMELEMEWDPLCATSHDQLVTTQSSLLHLLHYPSVNTHRWGYCQEEFSVEPFLFNISEYRKCMGGIIIVI